MVFYRPLNTTYGANMSSLPRLPSAGREPPAGLTTDHSTLLHSDQDALDALHKGRKSLVARAEVLIEGEAA